MSGQHHHHGHDHGSSFGRAFLIGIALNSGFVALEAGYGFATNSVALLADAGHNLSDVLGLVVAWGATRLAKAPASDRFTYGLRGSSILAALANAVFLMVAVGAIALEAVRRLADPQPVAGVTVAAVAAAGIVVNGVTAWLFARGRHGDINIRGAFLHMAADAAVSAGVVVAALVMLRTGWLWLDPAVSLVVAGVIVLGTWGLLRDAVAMALSGVPRGVERTAVHDWLDALPGVAHVHHLHIWPLSTTETALTVHLVMPRGHPGDHFLHDTCDALHDRFDVDHATIQIEINEADSGGSHHCATDAVAEPLPDMPLTSVPQHVTAT